MRVMLVAHHIPPDGIAGVERIVQHLARDLTRWGDSVSVVTRRVGDGESRPRMLRELLPDGTVHYRLAGGARPFTQFLFHHERLEQLFTAALAEANPDVIHFHHLFGLSPRFVKIAHQLRISVVVSLQDFYFACPLIQLRKVSGEICDGPDGGLECARTCFAGEGSDEVVRWGLRTSYFRTLLEFADRFVSPSRHVTAFFERFGVDPRRIRMVDNGVSLERRPARQPPTPREQGRLNVVYLGTVAPHKGVDVIVEALGLARLEASSLLVAGHVADEGYAAGLEAAAAGVPGLELRTRGAYELEDLPAILDGADCLVVPSRWPETFGIVAREALMRGVPILVARIGGLPEAVTEGKNGFTFTPDRPDELAQIFHRLARDDELVLRLREGVRQTHVVSVAEHAEAVRNVYLEAIEEGMQRSARAGEYDELRFLHEASVAVGFAATG